MQGVMHVMDPTGHTSVEWDTDVPESVEVAQERFRRELANGALAVKTREKEQIRTFDPQAEEITFIPAMAGG